MSRRKISFHGNFNLDYRPAWYESVTRDLSCMADIGALFSAFYFLNWAQQFLWNHSSANIGKNFLPQGQKAFFILGIFLILAGSLHILRYAFQKIHHVRDDQYHAHIKKRHGIIYALGHATPGVGLILIGIACLSMSNVYGDAIGSARPGIAHFSDTKLHILLWVGLGMILSYAICKEYVLITNTQPFPNKSIRTLSKKEKAFLVISVLSVVGFLTTLSLYSIGVFESAATAKGALIASASVFGFMFILNVCNQIRLSYQHQDDVKEKSAIESNNKLLNDENDENDKNDKFDDIVNEDEENGNKKSISSNSSLLKKDIYSDKDIRQLRKSGLQEIYKNKRHKTISAILLGIVWISFIVDSVLLFFNSGFKDVGKNQAMTIALFIGVIGLALFYTMKLPKILDAHINNGSWELVPGTKAGTAIQGGIIVIGKGAWDVGKICCTSIAAGCNDIMKPGGRDNKKDQIKYV